MLKEPLRKPTASAPVRPKLLSLLHRATGWLRLPDDKEVQDLRQSTEGLKSLLARRTESVKILRTRNATLRDVVARCRHTITKLNDRNAILKKRINAISASLAKLNDRNAILKKRINAISASLAIDPLAHNSPSAMDRFFDRIDDDTRYEEFAAALAPIAARHGICFDGKSVLDFGVGPGIVLARLLDGSTPRRVTGYDFSEAALAIAQERIPFGYFSKLDIYEGADERFDVVVCTEVLEHLEYPDRALSMLLHMTSAGGTILLTVPDGRIDQSRYHINFWSPESWVIFVRRTVDEALGEAADLSFGAFRVRSSAVATNNYAVIRPSRTTSGSRGRKGERCP